MQAMSNGHGETSGQSRVDPDVIEIGMGSGIAESVGVVLAWLLVFVTFPLSLFVCFKVVKQYETAVVFRMGRIKMGEAKGMIFVLPCIENVSKVDTRSSVYDIPPQDVVTKDIVTVTVDAVLYYRISNATIAVTKVANAHSATRLLAQTTLRGILGQRNLSELLSERDAISAAMALGLDEATAGWGIKVERVEVTDVRLPFQLQRAMAAEGEAQREAKAKFIAAEGEFKAARALKEAADTLSESAAAIQLRYLQTLTSIATEYNETIIFPLPVTLIGQLMNGRKKSGKKDKKIHNGRKMIKSNPAASDRTKSGHPIFGMLEDTKDDELVLPLEDEE